VQYDVLIIGAGPAGTAAALSAARKGSRVLLVERYGCTGGAFSLGMALTPVGFEPFRYWVTPTDPKGWVVQGLARELHDRMNAEGAVCKPVWDIETYKYLVDTMLTEAGVDVLFHAQCVDAIVENGRVAGAVLATRAGLEKVKAKICIDCSGDGDLFTYAGAEFELGRQSDNRPQPMTLASVFGKVNLPYREDMSYAEMMAVSQALVSPILKSAWEDGDIPPIFVGIMFPRVVKGAILRDQVWCRLVQSWRDPNSSWDMAQGEIEARSDLQKVLKFMRAKVPGFEEAVLLKTSAQIWPRESRRLVGVARLTEDDIQNNARYDDGITHGACFLEAHSPTPGNPLPERGLEWGGDRSLYDAEVDYHIRYGTLVPKEMDGLLVAGRCISSSHVAQSSSRMQITSMALGEAAGLAAHLCASKNIQPRDLNTGELRDELRGQGAHIE
jgi:hypothetical protein